MSNLVHDMIQYAWSAIAGVGAFVIVVGGFTALIGLVMGPGKRKKP